MTVVVSTVYGRMDIFETNEYIIGRAKEFHPEIVRVEVHSNGMPVASRSRPFPFIYKHFIFKTKKVQDEIRMMKEAMNAPKDENPCSDSDKTESVNG